MKKKSPLIKVLKLGLIIICIVIGLFIGFYKFPKQNIKMLYVTENGNYQVEYTPKDLEDAVKAEAIDVLWSEVGAQSFTDIYIYRYFKTVCIEKITESNLYEYGYISDVGIHYNAEGCLKLYKYAQSFLIERLIIVELLVAITIFLWIIVNAIDEMYFDKTNDNHGPIYEISNFAKNIMKYRQYMLFAARADLNAEVANSYLNRLWWILEPFCNMLVYVIVFSGVMGNSIKNYSTFVFSGLVLWNFFSHTINYSVKCVRNNRDIVTKIYVPKYVLLITNMILNFTKFLFSLLVLIVMMMIYRVPIGMAIFWVIPVYVIVIMISFCVGMIFLHYGVFIDDLGYAVGILLSMLMFLSGTFYEVVTTLSAPLNEIVLAVNPIAMLIDSVRNALFYNMISNVPLVIVWCVLSLLVGYIGIHIVNKNENGYVKVI